MIKYDYDANTDLRSFTDLCDGGHWHVTFQYFILKHFCSLLSTLLMVTLIHV